VIDRLLDELQYNDDESVDLYFGPEAPERVPESNWRKTVPGKGWFMPFRLDSPKQASLDRSWVLPDIEKAE